MIAPSSGFDLDRPEEFCPRPDEEDGEGVTQVIALAVVHQKLGSALDSCGGAQDKTRHSEVG